ncbi:MAG TPA: hypothetical protein V6D14_10575 [Coleofasciculaceae cyanobacterium]
MQPQRVGSVLITRIITMTLLAIATGCSQPESPQATTPDPSPTPALATSPKPSSPAKASQKLAASPTPTPQADRFPEAMDTAIGAATLTQSAVSKDDWNLVANQWQKAIVLLKSLPASHPKRALAQKKIAEYQSKLAYAKQQTLRSSKPTASAISSPSTLVASKAQAPQAEPPQAAAPSQPTTPSAPISSASGKVALANHLKQIGAKIYETFWCPVCRWQEKQFGAEASRLITRVECDPRGKNAKPQLCRQANIRAFPTWEINGQFYEGGMGLEKLAELSGYQGPRNFSN